MSTKYKFCKNTKIVYTVFYTVFFATEIVDYRSFYWVPLINVVMIKLYQELQVSYIMHIYFACNTQPNALKDYEASVHLSAKPNTSKIMFLLTHQLKISKAK